MKEFIRAKPMNNLPLSEPGKVTALTALIPSLERGAETNLGEGTQ